MPCVLWMPWVTIFLNEVGGSPASGHRHGEQVCSRATGSWGGWGVWVATAVSLAPGARPDAQQVLNPVYLSGWCMQSPGPGPGKARMSRCQRGDLHMCSSPSPSSAELSSPPLSTTEPRMEPGSHAALGNSHLCPGEGGGPRADGAARRSCCPHIRTSEHSALAVW